MPSERVQRQIDRLLDEAEAALGRREWPRVHELSQDVLALDPEHADARAFLDAAVRAGAGAQAGAPSDPAAVSESPSAPPLPSSFAGGRYAVRGFLGEGAKKRVYLAHDTKLDRDVAFALIKTDGLDADGLVRVRHEAQAMGRLGDHSHIVTVFDAGDEAGAPYFVSQYMAGGSVEDLLAKAEQHRLAPDRAMKVAEQVCQALSHAHGRGIIHRDLKPGNVWLDSDGNAALGDFGLAIAIDRSRMTMQGMMVGTVAYMPPEQALGRTPDARSDLYALGAMLYEMVTGRPPFLGDDAVGVISQHINTAPVAPSWHNPEVPQPLESLVLRLLAKSPDERPPDAAPVSQELRRIMERSTVAPPSERQGADEITDLRRLDWGRFVGRRDEMEQLKGTLESALSGKAALTFVAGEPGIGKSRLAEEFAVYAGLRGAQVLTGRCYEGEQTLPYRPFIDALRQYARTRPDGELRQQMGPGAPEIATLLSDVQQRFPDIQPAPQLEAEAGRLRLFDSIAAFLRAASTAQPLVLYLDDLHWSDRPSLQLLQHLARHVSNERVLLLGTYRDVELDRTHPLSDTLAALRRMDGFARVALKGLLAQEVFELLSSIEPAEETAAGRQALSQAIWQETEGNPFFVKEVLQHLVETGKLRHEGGHWTAGGLTVSDLGIPEGVREVIGRRLSRLGEACNRVLTRASAQTRGFTWEQLRAINPAVPEADLLDVLDEAVRAQLIAERKDETPVAYHFTHALIRQTLYEELSTPRRVLLHREIGEALDQLYAGNDEAHVGELAYHFYQAAAGGGVQKAIDYCVRAGARAAGLNGHDDAAGHYQRALQLLDMTAGADEAQRCALSLRLADVQWRSGQPSLAIETYRNAARLARRVGTGVLAECAAGFAEAAWLVYGDPSLRPESATFLTEALDALGDQEDATRVRLLGLRVRASRPEGAAASIDIASSGGYTSYMGGRDDEQVAEAAEAVAIARRLGDPGLVAFALGHLHGCMWRPDNPRERLRISEEMLARVTEAGELGQQLVEARVWLGIDHLDLGNMDAYEAQIEALDGVAAATRQPIHAWFPAAYRAAVQLIRGNLDRAEQLMEEALALGQKAQAPEALVAYAGQLSQLRQYQGRWREAEQLFRGLAASSPNVALFPWVVAAMLAETGLLDEASTACDAAMSAPLRAIPRDYIWLTSMSSVARCAFILHRPELGREALELVEPYADLNGGIASIASTGSVALTVAWAAAAAGEYEKAGRYFTQAIEFNMRTSQFPEAAMSQRFFARMLVERDAPGDRERALKLLQETIDLAQPLGMKRVIDDCLALKLNAQGMDLSSVGLYTSIDRVASAVESERPSLWRQAVAPDGTVTIMFSDIEDSTVLTERLGDQAWQELLRKHNTLIREQLRAHDGFEVKTMGDGFMVAFQSAKKALDCAIAIQRAFADHNAADGEHVKVRIGLHAGEAIKDGGDFYGKNVIMASRVAGQAKGAEILVSSLLRQLVESATDVAVFGAAREVELKGLSGTHTVFAVELGEAR